VNNKGYVNLATGETHGRDRVAVETIKSWAQAKDIPFVTWTDLSATLPERKPDRFCNAALTHLKSLDPQGIRAAVEYIVRAPATIVTPFRSFIMNDDWFKSQIGLLHNPLQNEQI
jgi:hypothetical protein